MKLTHWLSIVAAILVSTSAISGSGKAQSSTDEQRATFVEAVKELEADPMVEGARGKRQALFEWLVKVPDVEAKACADLLTRARDDSYPYSGEITIHEVLAAGVFAIEHPDKTHDDIAMYTASVEGALRVYEALLKSQPDARLSFLDDLLTKRDRGQLREYVAKVAKKKCK